ncbi:MAG: DUF4384 domain-containing protein [Candidatus Schekmanbacteria bacterium]|nr:DUF4384 domain-containing protein [Candidatus Schekmanbacteria bacterium]
MKCTSFFWISRWTHFFESVTVPVILAFGCLIGAVLMPVAAGADDEEPGEEPEARIDASNPSALGIVIVPDRFDVKIWVNKRQPARYRIGEPIRVYFRASRDAYVTIYDRSTDGSIVRLFPNRWDPDNFVRADRSYRIPSGDYDLRVTGPSGTEELTIYATSRKDFHLRHESDEDYEQVPEGRQRQTVERIQIIPPSERAVDTVRFTVGRRGHSDDPEPGVIIEGPRHGYGEEFVEDCYRNVLNRRPSREEMREAMEAARGRDGRERLVGRLLGSDEYYVISVYRALLRRDPDASGLRHYLGSLSSGHMSRSELIEDVLESPEYARQR